MKEEKSQSLFEVPKILKTRREKLKLSLADVEVATKIRGKYLAALEAGNYEALPNDIYSRGFVAKYADHLGLDGADIATRYIGERGGTLTPADTKAPKLAKPPKFVVTSRILLFAGIGVVAAAIVTYLVFQFNALAAPPKLDLANPAGDQVVYGSSLTLGGHVAGGADVFVNDSPILTDANGNFSDQLALSDGVNTIKVTAVNKLGKSTTITRNVLAKLPLSDTNIKLPDATFDGIALLIHIKAIAAKLTVKVDGKQVFSGTMLAGTSQLFKGSDSVIISTDNAGTTEVSLTNSAVAGKNLGTIGAAGSSKNDLEFTKTTNFQ